MLTRVLFFINYPFNSILLFSPSIPTGILWRGQYGGVHSLRDRGVLHEFDFWRREAQKVWNEPSLLLSNCFLSLLLWLIWFPEPPYRKKKRGKGKDKGSDKSDSDDLEVIKEWNTSSRGGNPEGRNRAEPVEEGMTDTITSSNRSLMG